MIAETIYIDKYGWTLKLFVAVTKYDVERIVDNVERTGANDVLVQRVRDNLMRGNVDTGFTYSNRRTRESVMVIGKTSSAREEMNSVSHEIRHLVDDIASTDGLAIRGEEVAYLTGDISASIYDVVRELLCCRCH